MVMKLFCALPKHHYSIVEQLYRFKTPLTVAIIVRQVLAKHVTTKE